MIVRRKIICFFLIMFLLISCSDNKKSIVEKSVHKVVRKEPSNVQCPQKKDVLSESNLYVSNVDEMYNEGIEAVLSNNVVKYNRVIRHYCLSKYPLRGLTIALLMTQKNKYGKAYFDIFNILNLFYGEEIIIDDDLIELLSKAKKHGYDFDEVYIKDTIIYYNQIR